MPSEKNIREKLKKLIESVGGTHELQSILEDFYQRMHDDVMIGFFFEGKDLKRISHQQAQFILNAAGLVDRFEGKSPSNAHLTLPPILTGHFDRRLVLLRETLNKHKLSSATIEDWVQFEESFRKIVVS